jgi:hypothetical protein
MPHGHLDLILRGSLQLFQNPIRLGFRVTEKWAAYKFTKNVYDIWMPVHFKRMCSVIDELPPDVHFEVSRESEPGESGLSQGLEITISLI